MKISRKFSISIFGALLAVCSFSLYSHYRLMMNSQQEELESLGGILGRVVEESLAYSMITRDADLLSATLRNLQDVEPISRILLLNTENRVVAGTDPDVAGKRLDKLDAGVIQAASGRGTALSGETYRWLQGVQNRSECHPCHSPAARYNGAIIIDFSTARVRHAVSQHIAKESYIFLSSFSFIGIVTFFLSNFIVIGRLNRVIDYMKRFKDGDEIVRIPVKGRDEIARLGQGFNEMADSISESQGELQRYAKELLSLAASSNVVSAVSRTENIYEAVCNIAVKELKLAMAWVGLVKKGSFELEAVAQSGFEEGYLRSVNITWDDSPSGMGPTGMAIKKKVPQILNDIATEPRFAFWRDEAMKRGYRSSMALPLLSSSGEPLGVLNLYSNEPEYFTRKRVRMFMIFSNQATAEIENRELVKDLEQSREELAKQVNIISRSHKEWQQTFDSITDMVSIHDRDYFIIKANKAVAEYFGTSPQEISRQKCCTLFHHTDSPPENCPHKTSMNERKAATEEVRDNRTGKLFRVSTFPYYSEEGEFIGSVHVGRDITLEKETEMRLVMSERLAALGQMASGLAHEINTPLASIAGCAEGLLMKVRSGRYDPQIFEEYLQIVEEEIQRCKSITTGMLSFVRESTYEKRDVRINDALDKALDIIGFQGRLREVVIERCYQEDLPVIRGSEGELRQVFLIIIVNALDAMDNNGTLTIGTSANEASACVRISDTGPGIDPATVHRIFDPFFTTKSDAGGTGLGLSIAHKIINNHGGTIDAHSDPGTGATFVITLPLA